MSKYCVGDFMTAIHSGLYDDSEYSFGQIIRIEGNIYVFRFVDNQEYKCDVKIIDSISSIIPKKIKMPLENPFEMYDFVEDSSSYHYFCSIKKDPLSFMNSKTNNSVSLVEKPIIVPTKKSMSTPIITKAFSRPQQVWISKCRHGRDCERLGCEKGPEFCPHGEGCERLACKAMYY